jgi:DNA repair ATPase RecN
MSAAAELKPFFFDEDGDRDLDLQFDPQQFKAVTPYSDDLDDEYQAAQDKLRELRQQEEQIKRQAAELEELTKKEQLFKTGRVEVCEELNRYLSILERETAEAQRLAEDCQSAQERLEGHLANINALRPELWSRADRKAELARALGYIESAEDEIDNLLPMINSFGKKAGLFGGKIAVMPRPAGTPSYGNDRGDFVYWLKSGFAFSLPFVGFAVIAVICIFFF